MSIKPFSSSTSSVQQQDQQKALQLLNPFEISEDDILQKVYLTHFHCVEKYDVGSLYSVASNVVQHSIEMSDLISKSGPRIIDQFKEDTFSFPRLPALKRIACQMICTARGEHYAHQTTMLILEQLKAYSWDAKAVIVLSAFALEYGKFWHLPLSPRDQLGSSLAELNGLHSIHENSQSIVYFSSLVKKAVEIIECITEWKRVTSAGYDINGVPALSDTLQEIPVVVYWAILTLVTCTSHIDFMAERGYRYELSKFDYKLDFILKSFKDQLDKCNRQIGAIEDYTRRKIIILEKGKDIVKVLKALIIPSDTHESKPIVCNGFTGEQIKIEEFKKKHVLLFISGLENIEVETQLLKSISDRLKEGPKEVEGYKKEDFKILWIPIVEDWNDKQRKVLETCLERTKIGWYVVKEFNFSTGIRLIREVFKYRDYPIIPLISPEGKVENIDAKLIISVWGVDGFPFRDSDHIRLTQQWNWFWTEISKLSPRIKEVIEKDCYIFIYGGTDCKWFQNFTTAMEKVKRHELIAEEDIEIELYPLGKDDSKIIPRFWIGMDSLLASRKQIKGSDDLSDFATRQLKRLIGLKQDPFGWVLLSKGSNMKILGQGEAMYRAAADFEIWKHKLHQDLSFDVAFKEYYESKIKDVPSKCAYSEYANYPTDILARISCPNMNCGRVMEVASVNYRCCHGRESDEALLGGVMSQPKDI